MVDYGKIDSFFNGEHPFEEKNSRRLSLKAKLIRGAKLIMPSTAAVLIALIMLYPSLKKDEVVANLDVTLPKKGELEKLHIEKTEFAVTDKNNRVSRIQADQVDETSAGSKVMKIINPQGTIPAGGNDKPVAVSSLVGYYDQNNNTLQLEQNVKAVYADGTTAETQEVKYDFNKSLGNGSKKLYAYGVWGKLWAEQFTYNHNAQILTLIGKSKVTDNENTLFADGQIRYYRAENKAEADKNVKIETPQNVITSDKMRAFIKQTKNLEFEKAEAWGNVKLSAEKNTMLADKVITFFTNGAVSKAEAYNHVKIIDGDNTMLADKVFVFFKTDGAQDIEKIEAYDNVKVITPDGVAKGDYGLYQPYKNEVELRHNVVITQNGSVIYGDRAVTDLKTSVSRVLSDTHNKRVSGVITGAAIKGEKNEKK